MKSLMLQSIEETSKALKDTLEKTKEMEKIAERIRDNKIFFAGSGSSLHVAAYGKMCFDKIRVHSEAKNYLDFIFHNPMLDSNSAAIVISVSGRKDAPKIAKHAKSVDSQVIGIINTEGSPITEFCDDCFFVPSGVSDSFINTKEYISQLYSMLILSYTISGKNLEDISEIPTLTQKTLDENRERIKGLVEKYKDKKHFVFLSSGPSMVLAEQSALKLREVCWKIKHSEALSVDELPHGRLFSLGDEETVFIVIDDELPEYLKNVKSDVEFFKTDNKLFAPIIYQPVFYLFTELMSREHGIDPDNPRDVEKIVKIF